MNIRIETQRLLLRRIEQADQHSLERLFCDPVMMRYLGGPWTPAQVTEARHEWHTDWGTRNRWYGLLVIKDSLQPVGTAGFSEDTIPGEPGLELSWFVLPEHQGQGFATEITHELRRFAFDSLGAARMLAETHPENPASNRVLEKLGFESLGQCHHTYDDLPGFETQVLWALTSQNWQRGTNTPSP